MTKEKAETKWKGHELEKLDQAVYLFDVSKIKTWQVNAVDSILSALGKWLLQILKATSVHNTSDGIEVHIKVGQTRINILKPVSNERMLDVAWLALEHGAPLIPDDLSWNEIKENTKKKKEALAKMIELLSSFNDQMRKATGECMQIPWQLATAQHPNMLEPNVLAGIAVWTLMAGGHGSSQARIDDLKERAVKSTELEVMHAKDVAGYLGNVNEHVQQLVQEGVLIKDVTEIVLKPVLETLAGGILVEVSKPDARAWKLIGTMADDLNRKRLRKEPLEWATVYAQIMQVHSQSTTGSKLVQGPSAQWTGIEVC